MSSGENVKASDEELIMKKDDDEGGKVNLFFFDNTIDESENEHPKPSMMEKPEMPSSDSGVMKNHENKNMKNDDDNASDMKHNEEKHVLTKTNNKSFMEMEVKRDKMRWLYMSELGAIFGEEKHSRESFLKLFGTRVSLRQIFKIFLGQKNVLK